MLCSMSPSGRRRIYLGQSGWGRRGVVERDRRAAGVYCLPVQVWYVYIVSSWLSGMSRICRRPEQGHYAMRCGLRMKKRWGFEELSFMNNGGAYLLLLAGQVFVPVLCGVW